MNKKIIYLSVFLILALFLVSACQKTVGDRLARIDLDCTDSDGGTNYWKKGTCVDAFGSNPDSCATGSDGSVLLSEKFCNSEERCDVAKDTMTGQYGIDCPNGCKDGACIKQERRDFS